MVCQASKQGLERATRLETRLVRRHATQEKGKAMKTPAYWLKEHEECDTPVAREHIAAIQSDAHSQGYRDGLQKALEVVQSCGGNHRDSTIRHNVQICARAIQAEAKKERVG